MNISSCASRLISSCIFFDEATVQISLTIILIGSVVFLLLNWIIRVLYILGKIILTGYMFSKHSLPISDRQLVLSLFAFQQHPLHGPIPTPAPESFDPILPQDAADCSLGPQNMGFLPFFLWLLFLLGIQEEMMKYGGLCAFEPWKEEGTLRSSILPPVFLLSLGEALGKTWRMGVDLSWSGLQRIPLQPKLHL